MIDVSWWISISVIITLLVTLLTIGVPISFSMGLTGVIGLCLFAGPNIAFNAFKIAIHSGPYNFLLVAVPLFILMAQIIIVSGISNDVFAALESAIGPLPGGLALASLTGSSIFAACTGASLASCATIGPVAIGEMIKRGYDKRLATGVIAAGGGLAIVIPPSIVLVLYGFIAEVSVAKLFIAGIIPGLMMAVLYIIYTVGLVIRYPSKAPRIKTDLSFKARMIPLIHLWPLITLIFLILGSIYSGFSTVSESAAMGVLGALAISLLYKKMPLEKVWEALLRAAETSGFILLIVVSALYIGFLLNYLQIPLLFTEFMASLSVSPLTILILVNIVILILGCLMDAVGLILVVTPIVLPTLVAAGWDPILLGVILTLNVEMGLTTPPIGINVFVIQGISKEFGVTFNDVVRGAIPYLFSDAIVLALLIIYPQLALWLPSTLRGV